MADTIQGTVEGALLFLLRIGWTYASLLLRPYRVDVVVPKNGPPPRHVLSPLAFAALAAFGFGSFIRIGSEDFFAKQFGWDHLRRLMMSIKEPRGSFDISLNAIVLDALPTLACDVVAAVIIARLFALAVERARARSVLLYAVAVPQITLPIVVVVPAFSVVVVVILYSCIVPAILVSAGFGALRLPRLRSLWPWLRGICAGLSASFVSVLVMLLINGSQISTAPARLRIVAIDTGFLEKTDEFDVMDRYDIAIVIISDKELVLLPPDEISMTVLEDGDKVVGTYRAEVISSEQPPTVIVISPGESRSVPLRISLPKDLKRGPLGGIRVFFELAQRSQQPPSWWSKKSDVSIVHLRRS